MNSFYRNLVYKLRVVIFLNARILKNFIKVLIIRVVIWGKLKSLIVQGYLSRVFFNSFRCFYWGLIWDVLGDLNVVSIVLIFGG